MGIEPRWIGGAMQPVPVRVRDAIAPIIDDHELTLLGVELSREGHRTILWIFVDTDEGATIHDCARATPEISATLDVADPVHESYELRVSSPGLDRPLMQAEHFEEFTGEEIHMVLMTPLKGRRKFTGVNRGLSDDCVVIECSDGRHEVPLAYIQKARIKYAMNFGKKRP